MYPNFVFDLIRWGNWTLVY